MRGGDMYNVSETYKELMKNPIRNQSHMKVALGLINQQAQATASVSDSSKYTGFSDLQTVFTKNDIGNMYATYEQNFTKADGTKYFLPRNSERYMKNGLISNNLFSPNFQIKFMFGYGNSDIRGLTIQFGENYPTKFTVTTSNGTETYFENNSDFFETDTVFSNTDSLTIKIEEMLYPNQRVRIFYVKFGQGLEYDNEWIISATSRSSLSAINESLPEINFSVTLKNEDQRFNVDNPSSEINFLESGQKLSVLYGYEISEGNIEWMQLHTLLVSEWSANDSQAVISGVDRFQYMNENFYKGQFYQNEVSLYDLAVTVMNDAGIDSSEYYIDTYLQKVKIKNPVPNVPHKEALQIIANAGRCILDYDRWGKIRMYSSFLPDFLTTSNGTVYFSEASSVDTDTRKSKYATYEENYTTADSQMLFPPKTGIAINCGYISSQISGENNKFSTNPVLTRTLEAKYKCFGLKIGFSSVLPKSFIIRTYADAVKYDEITISNVESMDFEYYYDFHEFDVLQIEFTETQKPNMRIHVDYITLGSETDYTVEYDDLYATPVGTQLEKVKNIKTSRSIMSQSGVTEELISEDIQYSGENIQYFFNAPHYSYQAKLENAEAGRTISIVGSGAYYVEVKITGAAIGETLNLSINGIKYNVSTSYVSHVVNNRGNDKEWDNPLISDESLCEDVCLWLADYYSSGIEYELDYRGEPALDCGDTIYQENRYTDELKVIIEEMELNFNGGIDGTLVTRRKERVDRAKNRLGNKRLF